jgi:hypothetical protein
LRDAIQRHEFLENQPHHHSFSGRPVTTQPAIAIMTERDATASQVWQIWSDP